VPAALMSNQIQVGATTPTNLLAAAEAGLDVVGICGSSRLQKTNPLISLVTRPGVTVSKADDLRGKRVGVPGLNAIIDLFFRKWLLNNKVPLKEVTIVEALLPQMPDMLKAGQVDAVAPIEPFVTRIVGSGAGNKSVDFYSEVNPDVIAAFWIAKREWADANRKAAQDFCASYREAIEWAHKNEDEAHQIEQKYLKFRLNRFPSWNTGLEPKDLEFVHSLMRELGVLRQNVDLNKVVWK
jgi:NitT/TauT family transport system substrate-binding protein